MEHKEPGEEPAIPTEETTYQPEEKEERFLVVVNPVSRAGKARGEGIWLLKKLARLGVNHEAFFTESPGHAESIVKGWVDKVDTVVSVGGDGTLNEVVNGMVKGGGLDKALAVFPAGTADDFAHNMGIPLKRKGALETVLGGTYRVVDLIRYNDNYAAVDLGVGVDAEIAYKTLEHKKTKIPAYFIMGFKVSVIEGTKSSSKLMHIESSNGVYDGRFLIAAFGNGSIYARYVRFWPGAQMDDGILNMTLVRPTNPIRAWYILSRAMAGGKHLTSPKVVTDKGSEFTLELKEDAFVQVDGEPMIWREGKVINISAVSRCLTVKVPGHGGCR